MLAVEVLERLHELGVSTEVSENTLLLRPGSRVPPGLVAALREHKAELLHVLKQRQATEAAFHCWVLEEWRRASIPDWRRILSESIACGDREREDYARWMLREALDDPEYQEPAH